MESNRRSVLTEDAAGMRNQEILGASSLTQTSIQKLVPIMIEKTAVRL